MEYKIGDKVRYIDAEESWLCSHIGIIVAIDDGDNIPYLVEFSLTKNLIHYWCREHEIKRIFVKGEQLKFDFMLE